MRPRPGERCAALDGVTGKWCPRKAVRVEQYIGSGELYRDFGDGKWATWVRAALCDKHSEPSR